MRAIVSTTTVFALLLALVLSASPACASARGRVYVRVGPPAPVVEVRAVAHGPGLVWIDGYHRWDGRRHSWVAGHWTAAPRGRPRWMPGRWVHARQGWFYVDGHWR